MCRRSHDGNILPHPTPPHPTPPHPTPPHPTPPHPTPPHPSPTPPQSSKIRVSRARFSVRRQKHETTGHFRKMLPFNLQVLSALEQLFASVINQVHYGTFCGPMSCHDENLIGPLAMQRTVEIVFNRSFGPKLQIPWTFVVTENEVSARQLASWHEVPLNFMVSGFLHCGTSSMHFDQVRTNNRPKTVGFLLLTFFGTFRDLVLSTFPHLGFVSPI